MKKTFYYALFICAVVGTMWFYMHRETTSGTLKNENFDVAQKMFNPKNRDHVDHSKDKFDGF